MDLKVVAVLICLSAFAISSTQAAIPGCCITTKKHVPVQFLRKVSSWKVQSSSGACDIDAVILRVRENRICVDQTVFKGLMEQIKEWRMKQRKVKKRAVKKRAVKKRAAKYNI